jgi:hypothetical protein
MGYLDLKEDGSIIVDQPRSSKASSTISFNAPICTEGKIDGRVWWRRGFVGPDKGEEGKYLLLPPDDKEDVPKGHFALRSRAYGVFVFWRGFFQSPAHIAPPVDLMQRTKIYL